VRDDPTGLLDGAPAPRGRYTYGHSAVVVDVHGQRSAEREASFFLPLLRPGMRLLDVGCGPGSITVGLAAAVAPGQVVGVDLDAGVLERGRALARERGVATARFERASAERLPFADGAFDAVFAHTLLEHVSEPARALAEMRRVLRPGGLIGVRDADWASGIWAPTDPLLERAAALYARVWEHNGGHPNLGRRLGALLGEAGFDGVRTSASFRWDGTPESSHSFGELLAARLALPNLREPVLAAGWSDAEGLERMVAACAAWSRRADAFAAMIMVEAVGWRPDG